MEVTTEFKVALTAADAWALLTDLAQLAPLLPGAELVSDGQGEYNGSLKVHVGTLQSTFRGTVRFDELDPDFGRAVLHAVGHEARGSGTASAVVTCSLSQSGGITTVKVAASVDVTGKMAQFGDEVLADAALKLTAQFVGNLESRAALAMAADQVVEAALDEVVDELDEEVAEEMAERAGARHDEEPEGEGAGEDSVESAAEAAAEEELVEQLAEAVVEVLVEEAVEELVEELGEEALQEMGEEAVSELVEGIVEAAAAELASEGSAADETESGGAGTDTDHRRPEPIDLSAPEGPSLARRLVPFASIAGGLFLLRVVIYALRRRKK